jgi:hypothetical protein
VDAHVPAGLTVPMVPLSVLVSRHKAPSTQSAKSSNKKPETLTKMLPKDYVLNEYDIICGRGRGFYHQPGNMKFHAIMFEHLEEYKALTTKLEKTAMVYLLVEKVLDQNDGNVHFVRYSTGSMSSQSEGWETLDHELICEKVGHALREMINVQKKGILLNCYVIHRG